jgi:tRNA dimethylallyltransferase
LAALTDGAKKVIFVQGPTAAGKSAWALEQASRLADSCIVNCDSVQIYKHVDIGSNKPSKAELNQKPHYLYSEVEFPNIITAGQYERLFFSTLEKLKEKYIFVVGGTGFYFQAIEKGMYPVSHIKNEVKTECAKLAEEKGFDFLYDWILSKDPIYAAKISRNDHYRIERAFELMRSENKSMTQIQDEFSAKQRPFPYPLLKIGVTEEKEPLREIITQRTAHLLQAGLIDEVKALLEKGMDGWEPLNSVGYKEVVSYLSGGIKQSELADAISMNTMKLVKKQKTWFQRDKAIHWVHRSQSQVSVVDSFVSGLP